MKIVSEFLKQAFPHIPDDLTEKVSAIITRDGALGEDDRQELLQDIDALREDVRRLKTELVAHKDGVANATMAGLSVLGERARQRRLEGYDDRHDDIQEDFSLSAAAMAYIADARLRGTTGRGHDSGRPPADWPYSSRAWKPKDVRRSLIIAAAMLIAEIERLDRLNGSA